MAELLKLEVATPLGLALSTDCESVAAPSVQGEFGVLPGHLPLLAALQCGLLKYRVEGKDHVVAVGPGFVEAEPDRVRVLTDQLARPKELDEATVRKELEAAEEALKGFSELREGPEYRELQRDVDWALARLEAIEVVSR